MASTQPGQPVSHSLELPTRSHVTRRTWSTLVSPMIRVISCSRRAYSASENLAKLRVISPRRSGGNCAMLRGRLASCALAGASGTGTPAVAATVPRENNPNSRRSIAASLSMAGFLLRRAIDQRVLDLLDEVGGRGDNLRRLLLQFTAGDQSDGKANLLRLAKHFATIHRCHEGVARRRSPRGGNVGRQQIRPAEGFRRID